MKKILLIILMLWGVASYAQPGYTTINSRYSWLAGKFNGLHIPAYAVTPSLNTGQYGGSGAIGLDSVTGRFYVYIQGSWRQQLHILDTASLLATQYYVDNIVALSNNFANADLTATGNRSHDWNSYDFIMDSIGQYVIRSNQTGTITGRYTTIGGKNLNLGVDINSFFDTDDFAKTQTNNSNGGSTVSLQVNAGSKYSEITNHPDSIYLGNTEGNISIDFIDAVSDTAAYKPLAWNPQTKRVVKHNYWPSGGGTPTLQQVLDAGSTLTSSETINVGANTLNITGSGFAFNLTGGAVASQLTGSFKAALLDVSSSSTNTVDRSTQFRAYTSGTAAAGYGSGIQFDAERASGGLQAAGYLDYVWTDVSGTYTNNIDFTGADGGALELFMNIQPSGVVRVNNLADTLATKAYARSVGGSGTPVSFGTDNQIPFMNATNDDFEYNAALTWNGTTFAADGGATFNESGANVDFRIEGDADANAFFVDASADAVGIGTNAPGAKLQIEASSGSYLLLAKLTGGSANRLELERTTHGILRLSSENGDQDANIIFSAGVSGSNTRPLWYAGRTGGDPSPFQIRSYHPSGAFFEQRLFIQAQGEMVINEGGLDRDTRFETDNDANGLFINAGTDRIGIGTASPNAWLGIKAGTTASGQINFTPGVAPSSPNDGDLWYEDTNDRLMFRQNATSVEFIGVSAVNSVTPTAQNRTLTVLINGVTYYITAKTSND